jgi:diaminopimelate epimerase
MKNTIEKKIELGRPVISPVLVPVIHRATPNCINETFMVNGTPYKVTALSFGEPFGVVVVEDVDNLSVSSIGPQLASHPLFPLGANIVFAQVLENNCAKARVWQKNTGEVPFTPQACGAAATALMMLHKIMINTVKVYMGGSPYTVEWDKGSNNVTVTI